MLIAERRHLRILPTTARPSFSPSRFTALSRRSGSIGTLHFIIFLSLLLQLLLSSNRGLRRHGGCRVAVASAIAIIAFILVLAALCRHHLTLRPSVLSAVRCGATDNSVRACSSCPFFGPPILSKMSLNSILDRLRSVGVRAAARLALLSPCCIQESHRLLSSFSYRSIF